MAQELKAISKAELIDLPIIGDKPKDEKEEKFLREIRTYEFLNIKEPGIMISFPYGSTKKKHNFQFMHGGKYKVPRFIARHIENCSTPVWKWRPDGTGVMHKERIGTDPRFQMRELYE